MTKAPERPRFGTEWNAEQASRLNAFCEQVVGILNGGVSVSDNVSGFWKELNFGGPAASLSIASGLIRAPKAVFLARLYNMDTGTDAPVTFSWSFNAGDIVTASFSALASGTYRVTLLVIKG
jgi:hypothetical protein